MNDRDIDAQYEYERKKLQMERRYLDIDKEMARIRSEIDRWEKEQKIKAQQEVFEL